jgi:hypothetical protein
MRIQKSKNHNREQKAACKSSLLRIGKWSGFEFLDKE